ncbi:transposase [Streptacidiphilus sp. N1-3]|uniref:Transposase n=1 Tax=Streptacidiphilus alkalitolerans TaxID=3342712 RepID=A0ABV6WZF2_9ACTN
MSMATGPGSAGAMSHSSRSGTSSSQSRRWTRWLLAPPRRDDVSVDSTVARAHQDAAGARKKGLCRRSGPEVSPPRRTTTVSGARAAGLTTKLHLAVEQGQRPLALLVTAGQWHDSPQCQPVLERIRVPRTGPGRPRTGPNRVRADRAHGSRGHRAHLRRHGIKCTRALLPAGWSSAWTYPSFPQKI